MAGEIFRVGILPSKSWRKPNGHAQPQTSEPVAAPTSSSTPISKYGTSPTTGSSAA
jgi:hypothetical protein